MKVLAAVMITVSLLASTASAQTPPSPQFHIGALGTFSGPFGVMGESMRRGAELAAEQRGSTVLGAPIKFTWEDDETKPQVAVQKATRFASEKVHMMFAPVSSASSFAVMKVVEREKTPFLVTLSTLDDITAKSGNPYTFRTSNTNDMEIRMMLKFVELNKYKKVFLAGSDYKVGRDAGSGMKRQLEAMGVNVVGEEYAPLGTRDFSILINKIAQSDADAVYNGMAGNEMITFLKQADQVKLGAKKVIFGQLTIDESIGKAVGAGGLGVYSVMRYHFSLDNEANKKFVAAYRKKHGEYPDQYAGEAFDGMSWFLDTVDSTKSWDKEKWAAAFRGSKRPNSIEGSKNMRICDNQAEQPGYYGRAVKGTGDLPEVTMQVAHRFQASEIFAPCP